MCASGPFPFYCSSMSSMSWLRKRPHAFDVAVGAAVWMKGSFLRRDPGGAGFERASAGAR